MNIPEDMVAELAAWNGGKGVSIETWIASEGHMKLAVGYASIFWPAFVVLEDYVVRDGTSMAEIRGFEAQTQGDRRAVEAVLNHVHIADLQSFDSPETTAPRVKVLLKTLREIYEAKLSWQFPDRAFVVRAFEPEDPNDLIEYQLTFWQKKHERA